VTYICYCTDSGLTYSWIQYEQLVDRNASFRNLPIVLEPRTFYGQLQHVILVPLAAVPSVGQEATNIILGVIRSCAIESHHSSLDIHYYSRDGPLEIVDLSTIQCLVARIKDRGQWAIIDRSGTLARPLYTEIQSVP
jgi:hypothetical protein